MKTFLILLFFQVSLFAHSSIVSFYSFGQEKKDLVVLLENGTAWKVYSKDKKKLAKWNIGESVHVGTRSSSKKLDHLFRLHKQKESVRVMLIDYGDSPLKVAAILGTFPNGFRTTTIPVVDPETLGVTYTSSYYQRYKMIFLLNDGSKYSIGQCFARFTPGTSVYLDVNKQKGGAPFLISGIGKKAFFVWATIEESRAPI